jgi:hypothetical protein
LPFFGNLRIKLMGFVPAGEALTVAKVFCMSYMHVLKSGINSMLGGATLFILSVSIKIRCSIIWSRIFIFFSARSLELPDIVSYIIISLSRESIESGRSSFSSLKLTSV